MTKKEVKKKEKRLLNKALKLWAVSVKARDNNKCVICGSTKMLNAHHIIPRQDKNFNLDIDNGISLCPSCHRFSFVISAHHNPFIFYLWFQENREAQFLCLKGKAKLLYNKDIFINHAL